MQSTLTRMLLTGLLAVASCLTYAANPHEVAKDRAEATRELQQDTVKQDYKLAKERCESLHGDAEDICLKDARADYKTAMAQAKADEKSAKAYAEANEETDEAEYKAAKEHCKVFSGKLKETCIGEAKVKYYQ